MIRPGAKVLQEKNKFYHITVLFFCENRENYLEMYLVSYSKSTIVPILLLLKETVPKSCDIKENVSLNFTVRS